MSAQRVEAYSHVDEIATKKNWRVTNFMLGFSKLMYGFGAILDFSLLVKTEI
jgi:hypothetical protein